MVCFFKQLCVKLLSQTKRSSPTAHGEQSSRPSSPHAPERARGDGQGMTLPVCFKALPRNSRKCWETTREDARAAAAGQVMTGVTKTTNQDHQNHYTSHSPSDQTSVRKLRSLASGSKRHAAPPGCRTSTLQNFHGSGQLRYHVNTKARRTTTCAGTYHGHHYFVPARPRTPRASRRPGTRTASHAPRTVDGSNHCPAPSDAEQED